MKDMMQVSSNPHVRSRVTTSMIMYSVVFALLPATIFGIFQFGWYAALIVAVTTGTAVLTEHLFCLIQKKPSTVKDGSAIVTGLLLGLNLPPHIPVWIAIFGSVFAIVVVKLLFGGLGQNFMNPALGARCFLVISFAKYMTNFDCDSFTGPTPLALIKDGQPVNVFNMVLGRTGGTIGETSVIAIVLGACFLIWLGVIDLRIPGTYILTFAIFVVIFGNNGLVPYLTGSSSSFFNLTYLCSQLAGGGLTGPQPPLGDLGADAHGLRRRGRRQKRTIRVRGQKGAGEGAEHTARPRHKAEHVAAALYPKDLLPIGNQIRLPGLQNHSAGLFRQKAGVFSVALRKVGSVHPALPGLSGAQGTDLTPVAANDRRLCFPKQQPRRFPAKTGGSDPHGIQHNGLVRCRGGLPGK